MSCDTQPFTPPAPPQQPPAPPAPTPPPTPNEPACVILTLLDIIMLGSNFVLLSCVSCDDAGCNVMSCDYGI